MHFHMDIKIYNNTANNIVLEVKTLFKGMQLKGKQAIKLNSISYLINLL